MCAQGGDGFALIFQVFQRGADEVPGDPLLLPFRDDEYIFRCTMTISDSPG
ncbi:hypothetical protein D3C81_2240380 [compost metagenome]